MSDPKNPVLPWWKIALMTPVFLAVVPVAIAALVLYLLASTLLYPVIWLLWCARGKDVLFVYSESPVWRSYLEAQILPKIAHRAIIMNWSKRKKWRASLARMVFSHFGGSREFNPLGVVFRPWRRAQVFRFWQPFRDFKHGHTDSLQKLEKEFSMHSSPRPNKAPEPTRTTVTPRAFEVKIDSKLPIAGPRAARGAPAVRVAHL